MVILYVQYSDLFRFVKWCARGLIVCAFVFLMLESLFTLYLHFLS